MKARIVVIDDDGKEYEGEVFLSERIGKTKGGRQSVPKKPKSTSMDFGMNERAFCRQYAVGMSGSKKFTLLLAYLSKGDCTKKVELKQIERCWDRMTSLLGGKFNYKYSNKAREYGWADTVKQGQYKLSPPWAEILSGN